MRSGSWMLTQLDLATRGYHVQADAGRIALLTGTITRERYRDHLIRVFQFEAPIEARWAKVDGLADVIDLSPRLRVGFLVSDLGILGSRPAELPPPAAFSGVEQALGWMYAVERGRRMNSLLHRHLLRRIPHVVAIASNYLTASSPCGTRWQHFGLVLDRHAHNHLIADQIINAAVRAFRSLRTLPRVTGAQAA